jgi:hypothetical protein
MHIEERRMSLARSSIRPCLISALFCVLLPVHSSSQQTISPDSVPPNFHVDAVFAARMRALLVPSTQPATGRYATGKHVLDRLTAQLPPGRARFLWDLRIARCGGNIFSSPDGTIFVDEDLARLLGAQRGLWAAALAHEVAHTLRRDWARRYLFQKSLQASGSAQLLLDNPGSDSSWTDPASSATRLAAFCQSTELEADAEGLRLMARAGFHPAFMPALYHMLRAREQPLPGPVRDASHPLWDERDEQLRAHFTAAAREFDRLWPARYASPGGNPPVVVYPGPPVLHRTPSGTVELAVPLHCDNLAGAVEVVVQIIAAVPHNVRELRQYTGCTSNHTLVTFSLPDDEPPANVRLRTTISVLDDRGTLLARGFAPGSAR